MTCFCDDKRERFEPINCLPLPIPEQEDFPNIHHCLSQLKHPEDLLYYNCQSCESATNAIKILELSTSPDIFVFQFKRFEVFSNSKNQTLIQFPITGLNISEHILEESENSETAVYDLTGVIQHIGHSIKGGHYISLCKHSTGKWYKFDDDRVNEISDIEIVNHNAYILIYVKQKLSAVSTIPSLLGSSSNTVDMTYEADKS